MSWFLRKNWFLDQVSVVYFKNCRMPPFAGLKYFRLGIPNLTGLQSLHGTHGTWIAVQMQDKFKAVIQGTWRQGKMTISFTNDKTWKILTSYLIFICLGLKVQTCLYVMFSLQYKIQCIAMFHFYAHRITTLNLFIICSTLCNNSFLWSLDYKFELVVIVPSLSQTLLCQDLDLHTHTPKMQHALKLCQFTSQMLLFWK